MAPRMKFHGTGRGGSGNLSYRGANEDEYPVGHGNVNVRSIPMSMFVEDDVALVHAPTRACL